MHYGIHLLQDVLKQELMQKSYKKFLGHYSISITLDLYTHITNEKAKEDMNKLGNLYKKNSIDRNIKNC